MCLYTQQETSMDMSTCMYTCMYMYACMYMPVCMWQLKAEAKNMDGALTHSLMSVLIAAKLH